MEGFGSIFWDVYIPFDPTMFLGISFTVFIIGRNEKFRSLKLANSKINCGTLQSGTGTLMASCFQIGSTR